MKKALVLGGGGAKGSYQIGVWKALRKLHIKFDIVTGSSIGSINGAMYAAKKYHLAKRMWLKIKTSDFFEYDIGNPDLKTKDYIKTIFNLIKEKGMSFNNAEQFLRKYVKEDDIRKSNIDYGLLTYSLTTKKARALRKDAIPKGKLIDYICASSTCYPVVKKKQIDDEAFIDGGFYDNLPINLAIDMGAEEILAVDLSVFAVKKEPKNKNIKIEEIKMKDKTPFTLSFDKKTAKKNIKFGYNDTMKHFNKLDGNIYTFRKNDLKKNYLRMSNKFIALLKSILLEENRNKVINELFNLGNFNTLLRNIKQGKSIEYEINQALEYLGDIFNIKKEEIYNINKYNRLLVLKVKELDYIKINKNLKGKFLISYIFNKYKENGKNLKKELFNIALIFPKDFLAAMYLISITEKYEVMLKAKTFYDEVLNCMK